MCSVTPNTKEIIKAIFKIEFWEKISKESTIVGKEELIKWSKYFTNNRYNNIPYISNSKKLPLGITDDTFERLNITVRDSAPIQQILKLGQGKISICGPRFFPIKDSSYSIFNFYFCSCTIAEANNILVQSINILEAYVTKSGGRIIYNIRSNEVNIMFYDDNIDTVSFHCVIYKDVGEMLRNIGPSIYQQGYNSHGYFATISGSITAAMVAFPLDTNFRELTYEYMPELGIDILFHGLTRDIEEGDSIKLSNGEILHCGFSEFDIEYTGLTYIRKNNYDANMLPTFCYYNNVMKRSTNVKQWISDYEPFVVGISDDKYIALNNIRKYFSLDDDVFHLLCYWCLHQEMVDARNRLMNI